MIWSKITHAMYIYVWPLALIVLDCFSSHLPFNLSVLTTCSRDEPLQLPILTPITLLATLLPVLCHCTGVKISCVPEKTERPSLPYISDSILNKGVLLKAYYVSLFHKSVLHTLSNNKPQGSKPISEVSSKQEVISAAHSDKKWERANKPSYFEFFS